MTPAPRTPQQRDRRFARVRRLSQALLLGSGVVSAITITFIASAAKPYVAVPVSAPNSSSNASGDNAASPPTTVGPSSATSTPAATPSTTQYTPPTTVPVTTTTTCFSTPSGQVTCN